MRSLFFFQPAAIHRLFGLTVGEIVNRDHGVHAVLGWAGSQLYQTLGNARSFRERVQVAEQFIISRSVGALPPESIELTANQIMRSKGGCRIDNLADQAGLSVRNFQRRFRRNIGVPPKLFARIVRFQQALKNKAAHPDKQWTTVAHEFGYYDHMHMIHDFQQLAGETPTAILAQMEIVLAPQLDGIERQSPELLAT